MLCVGFFDKKSCRKTRIPTFWKDLFCKKAFFSEKVEVVNPTTFSVTEHKGNYRKVDFYIISHPFRATERGLRY